MRRIDVGRVGSGIFESAGRCAKLSFLEEAGQDEFMPFDSADGWWEQFGPPDGTTIGVTMPDGSIVMLDSPFREAHNC